MKDEKHKQITDWKEFAFVTWDEQDSMSEKIQENEDAIKDLRKDYNDLNLEFVAFRAKVYTAIGTVAFLLTIFEILLKFVIK